MCILLSDYVYNNFYFFYYISIGLPTPFPCEIKIRHTMKWKLVPIPKKENGSLMDVSSFAVDG